MTAVKHDLLTMLVSGGDDRLLLDPATGRNMYGYGPAPAPGDLAFSSSTASTISTRGYAAARDLWNRIAPDVVAGDANAVYGREAERIRSRLKSLVGLTADEADVILAASGTDLHLILPALLAGKHGKPVLTLSLTGSETGSGVPLMSAGSHAMPHALSGRAVEKGGKLAPDVPLTCKTLAARLPGGALRPEGDIAVELTHAISGAIAEGHHCLLIATDVSKTGLIAPGLATVFALKERFGDRLDILVDACQFRVAPTTLKAYLGRACFVAVTGSKFMSGPIFSGALFVPASLAASLKSATPCVALSDYSGAGDWPADWAASHILPRRRNFGLLLRWQAALAEVEPLFARHPLKIGWVMLKFAAAVTDFIKEDKRFATIPTRVPDRSALSIEESYDTLPSVHPFLLKRGDQFVPADEMARIYRDLQSPVLGPAIRLGQPVALGKRDGVDLAALRLCLGAPSVEAAAESPEALDRLVADGLTALTGAAEAIEARAIRVA